MSHIGTTTGTTENAQGIYNLTVTNMEFPVYCTEDGWTVIQSRGQFGNPIDYFFRGWDEYEKGFGTPGQ